MKEFLDRKNLILDILIIIIIFMLIVLLIAISNNKRIVIVEKQNESQKQLMDENIVFFGDSITHQYELEKYYNKHVVNSGINGDLTEYLINRIDNDVYKYNPSKVFLLIGINDLHFGKTDDEIIGNIETIIEGINENRKNALIYVESIYPINRTVMTDPSSLMGFITNDDVKRVNKKIKKLCEELDVTYIDVYNELIDSAGNLKAEYTREGLHLTELGYQKVTSVLSKYVNE